MNDEIGRKSDDIGESFDDVGIDISSMRSRLEKLQSGRWKYKNTCLNIECKDWREDRCCCDGNKGCCN